VIELVCDQPLELRQPLIAPHEVVGEAAPHVLPQ